VYRRSTSYAIALLPTFRTSPIFVVFVGFWPVFLNAAAGAAAVPARHRDNARILGLSRFAYLRRVVFPASLPIPGWGWDSPSPSFCSMAELFGANAGQRFVQYYADFADYPRWSQDHLHRPDHFLAMGLLD
jgi:NitT/TauT family transport system permease protein